MLVATPLSEFSVCSLILFENVAVFTEKQKPLRVDLYNHIIPRFAARWRVIGSLLGIRKGDLDTIEHDHRKARPCCYAVLDEWLDVDPTASWKKMIEVIDSSALLSEGDYFTVYFRIFIYLAVCSVCIGGEALTLLSIHVGRVNAEAHFGDSDYLWKPYQPRFFIPLRLLIQPNEVASSGNIQLGSHDPDAGKTTKDVTEIFISLENSNKSQFIIIEGAPGIGKTALLREIAYRSGMKTSLQNFTLVLFVRLCDRVAQEATSIIDLLLQYCDGDRDDAILCKNKLREDGGRSMLFLFDGFDEFFEHQNNDKLFINQIINRRALPLCGLVVSSRPHASEILRHKATIKVDILGFFKEEQHQYIVQSLQRQPQKVEKLTCYLRDHLNISHLCLVPFNLAILLYLYKEKNYLPSDPTKLYNHFILLAISRHLAKSGCSLDDNIEQLTDLREPYYTRVKQLSKLALLSLNQQVIANEIDTSVCPDLLALQDIGFLQKQSKSITSIFPFKIIQEYLAAHYIIHDLQGNEELQCLREWFGSKVHENMFNIYISITKGQRPSFQTFLSDEDDNVAISSKYLCNQLKCFYLFRSFYEAGDTRMCMSIEEATIFKDKEIDLSSTKLSATDLECVLLFLTSCSNKHWAWLNLCNCYIQDLGLSIVHKNLIDSHVTISELWLDNNNLSTSSSSVISDIVVNCEVEELAISGNHTIGESSGLYSMLNHSSMLTRLHMNNTTLSSVAAKTLFNTVKDNKNLKELYVKNNNISDDATYCIITCLTLNKSLERLEMYGNPITGESIVKILQAFDENNTLLKLVVSRYSPTVKYNIETVTREINTNRKNQGVQEKLIVDWQS